MQFKMPSLVVGQVYEEHEVSHLFVDHGGESTDWGRVRVRFPWHLNTHEPDMERFRADDEMIVRYAEVPIEELADAIRDWQQRFADQPEERKRVDDIKALYAQGEPVYPLFAQVDDPKLGIREGRHRAVALLELGATMVPFFLAGYRDWL